MEGVDDLKKGIQMGKEIKLFMGLLTLIGTIVAGYCFLEDRVEAKTDKVKTEVKQDVDELKETARRKNEKQDEDLDTLKEYSIRQSAILERVTENLDKLDDKLDKK